MYWRALVMFLVVSRAALAASPDDIDFVTASSLPPDVWTALAKGNDYGVEARLNPFYLQADFDGDGTRDTAVLVKHRASGKKGIAFVMKGGRVSIVGGGKEIGNGGDDLAWMDAWYPVPRTTAKTAGKGDAILAIKTESAGGLIFWDGRQFQWQQQGD